MPSTKTYAIAAALLVVGGLGAGAWVALNTGSDRFAECGGGTSTGAAAIGGPFTLVDQAGKTVTEADVIDKPTLVYFGYAFCPDICPVDVAIMGQAADLLAEDGYDVNTAFITVDPARDHGEALAEFVDAAHPDMIGLTGTEEQIAAAAKAYRVYYNKAESDDPDYYLMDHSAFTYLMAPEAGFLNVFRHGTPAEDIAGATACYADALAG